MDLICVVSALCWLQEGGNNLMSLLCKVWMKKKGEHKVFFSCLPTISPTLHLPLPAKGLFPSILGMVPVSLCVTVIFIYRIILFHDHRLYASPGQPSRSVFSWQKLENSDAFVWACPLQNVSSHWWLICIIFPDGLFFPNSTHSEFKLWRQSELGLILTLTLTIWPYRSYLTFPCSSLLTCKVRLMVILTIEGSDEDQMR